MHPPLNKSIDIPDSQIFLSSQQVQFSSDEESLGQDLRGILIKYKRRVAKDCWIYHSRRNSSEGTNITAEKNYGKGGVNMIISASLWRHIYIRPGPKKNRTGRAAF